VRWAEVQQCHDDGDPELLSFETDDILARVAADGDLFAPLLTTAQELPRG
jgi:bifunctional non-homologous end joining protein LigD